VPPDPRSLGGEAVTVERRFLIVKFGRRLSGRRAYWQQLGDAWFLAERQGWNAWELFAHRVRI
jgi:hypothetical protein